jgi:hypothetical protein
LSILNSTNRTGEHDIALHALPGRFRRPDV